MRSQELRRNALKVKVSLAKVLDVEKSFISRTCEQCLWLISMARRHHIDAHSAGSSLLEVSRVLREENDLGTRSMMDSWVIYGAAGPWKCIGKV